MGQGVLSRTQMVADITRRMLQRVNKTDCSLSLAEVFESLQGKDCDFEQVSSNILQPLKLYYTHNIAKKSLAIVFVCPKSFKKDEKEEADAKAAYRLFKEGGLNFDKVRIFRELSVG